MILIDAAIAPRVARAIGCPSAPLRVIASRVGDMLP